jgi:hypothetical protein
MALLASDLTVRATFTNVRTEVLLLSGRQDDDPLSLAALLPIAHVELIDAHHGNTMTHPHFEPAVLRFLLN